MSETASHEPTINKCWKCGRRGPWRVWMDMDHLVAECRSCGVAYDIGHSAIGFDPDASPRTA